MPSRVQLFQLPDHPLLAFAFEIVSSPPRTSAGIGTRRLLQRSTWAGVAQLGEPGATQVSGARPLIIQLKRTW